MGQSLFPYIGSLFCDPVVWLPRQSIAFALVYQHLLKLVLGGLFFFKFLELRGLKFQSALLGSILFAASAYMCMGSCWTNIGSEAVCFAFLLFSVEHALVRGRWIYVPFAVAVLGLLTPFHLYLGSLILILYVPARLFELNGWMLRPNLRLCFWLAGVALLGAGVASIVWLDSAAAILNSPRGSGLTSYTARLSSSPVFRFESQSYYLTAILRSFSNDLAGTADSFRGWNNYLEAPMSYCGLLTLLLLPQVFVAAKRRQRALFALFICLIVTPVVLPWFRYLFWLFQGDYFRTFSLFSVFVMITLSMIALSRYIERRTINFWLLGATLLILLAVLHAGIQGITPGMRKTITFFLFAYAALLTAGHYLRKESIFSWVLMGLCAAELCHFDRITVVDRSTVPKSELREKLGYNDYTVNAVQDIQAQDKGFYRITKLYSSGGTMHTALNDALVFGYFGTMSYSSFNNVNYVRFLMALDAIPRNPSEEDTRWVKGTIGRPELGAFVCEKYLLTVDPVPIQTDPVYEFVSRYDNVYVFRNKKFIPLGLFYTKYVSEDSFKKLPTSAKDNVVQHAVVLYPNDSNHANVLSPLNTDGERDAGGVSELQIRSFSQNRIEGTVRCDDSGVVVFQTPFDLGWRVRVDGASATVLKVDFGLLGIGLTKGEHNVELRYRPPFLVAGTIVAIVSALILGLIFWRRPRFTLE